MYCVCMLLSSRVFFFFFFQAEDGIRDIGVTGVQTCALPILIAYQRCASWFRGASSTARRPSSRPRAYAASFSSVVVARTRSEERRVGKGVDLGGRRIIKKKKQHKSQSK